MAMEGGRQRWGLVVVLGAALIALPSGRSAAGAERPCICRANGQDYPLGTTICLKTPDGGRLARCDMHLNNTSWSISTTPCPTAARVLPPRS